MRIWINKKEITGKYAKPFNMLIRFPIMNLVFFPVWVALLLSFIALFIPAAIVAILLGLGLKSIVRFKPPRKKKGCRDCDNDKPAPKPSKGFDNIKVKDMNDVTGAIKNIKDVLDKFDNGRRKNEKDTHTKER